MRRNQSFQKYSDEQLSDIMAAVRSEINDNVEAARKHMLEIQKFRNIARLITNERAYRSRQMKKAAVVQ